MKYTYQFIYEYIFGLECAPADYAEEVERWLSSEGHTLMEVEDEIEQQQLRSTTEMIVNHF